MCYSLDSLKGVYIGDYMGLVPREILGVYSIAHSGILWVSRERYRADIFWNGSFRKV